MRGGILTQLEGGVDTQLGLDRQKGKWERVTPRVRAASCCPGVHTIIHLTLVTVCLSAWNKGEDPIS